jgi:cytochrome c biogenesis protein CcdA
MQGLLEHLSGFLSQSPWLAYGGAFLAGVVSSSSPCVLAALPLVIGYIGGTAKGSRKLAWTYSLLFVLGLTLTFTLLGAIAGLFGQLFGVTGKGWFIGIGAVVILMGLFLIGLIPLRLPTPKLLTPERSGAMGALLMGLLIGAVSSPCATPVLVVILALVAAKAQVLYGLSLLFTYSIGHCALIFLAGVATGFAQAYLSSRKVQAVSLWTKRASGAIVVCLGLYLILANL